MHQLERILEASDLAHVNLRIEGWRATFDIERPDRLSTRLSAIMPNVLLRLLNPIIPTLIYRIERGDAQVYGYQ